MDLNQSEGKRMKILKYRHFARYFAGWLTMAWACATALFNQSAQAADCGGLSQAAVEATNAARQLGNSNQHEQAIAAYAKAFQAWGKAAAVCTGKELETARAGEKAAKEGQEREQSNLENQRCTAADRNARSRLDAGQKAFESQKFKEAAEQFTQARDLYREAVKLCANINAEAMQKNAELMDNNAAIAARNDAAVSRNQVIDACKSVIDAMNINFDKYLELVEGKLVAEWLPFINKADEAAKTVGKDCQSVLRSKENFDKTAAVIAKANTKANACSRGYNKTISARDKLLSYATDAKPGYPATVKEFMLARRDADENCEGATQEALRNMRNSEFEFLAEEKSCLPALRKAAKGGTKPSAGACKTKLFAALAAGK